MEYDEDAQERTRGLLRYNGDGVFRYLQEQEHGDPEVHSRPPFFITWCPPRGSVVAAISELEAHRGATTFAGDHPGQVVAVYKLVGYAFVPRRPAPFLPVNPEAAEIEQVSTIAASSDGQGESAVAAGKDCLRRG
jgi:hypothetical protein